MRAKEYEKIVHDFVAEMDALKQKNGCIEAGISGKLRFPVEKQNRALRIVVLLNFKHDSAAKETEKQVFRI